MNRLAFLYLPPISVLEEPSDSSRTSGSDSLEQRKGGKCPRAESISLKSLSPTPSRMFHEGKFKKRKEEETKKQDGERTLRGLTEHMGRSHKSGPNVCYLRPFPSKKAFLYLDEVTTVFAPRKRMADLNALTRSILNTPQGSEGV